MDLFQFKAEQKKLLIQKVKERTFDVYAQKNEAQIEQILEEMIYWEKKRIQKVERHGQRKRKIQYWENYKQTYLASSQTEREALLKESIEHYGEQILGNFSPFVYTLATKALPHFLTLLLNTLSLKRLVTLRRSNIHENIFLSGHMAWARKLSQKGTLVFTPTHVSNLDSLVMGIALFYADLPPVMYGAGLNLFKNKLIGYFMNNLGAYKVDRLRIHPLYKDVLKEYAACSMELGYHNLYFPGGTRSRSGTVEKRLKLGLLGTTLKAYVRNLKSQKPNPNIYIIPVNLNSHLTLEAETLIDDFLAASGQSRYIIENDEFSKPKRVLDYVWNMMKLDSKVFVHFGEPLDPFGNRVDEEGVSRDAHGRVIDISRYVKKDGVVDVEEDRDQNYTKELGAVLLDVFHRNNRVLSTNIVAFTLYEMIAKRYPDFDIYKLLRTHTYSEPISLVHLYERLDKVRALVQQLAIQQRIIDEDVVTKDSQDIVNEALKIFGSYHNRKTVYRVGDQIHVGDLLLLYYYHNRLVGYNLEDMMWGGING